MLPQKISLVGRGEVVEGAEHLITEFLVKRDGLKAVCIEIDLCAVPVGGCFLDHLDKLCADVITAPRLVQPKNLYVKTVAPFKARDTPDTLIVLVVDQDGHVSTKGDASQVHVEVVNAVFEVGVFLVGWLSEDEFMVGHRLSPFAR